MSSIDPSREIVPWTPPEKMDLVTYITTSRFYGEFYNPLPPYTVTYRDVFGIRTSGDELKMKLLKLGFKKRFGYCRWWGIKAPKFIKSKNVQYEYKSK